MALSIWRHALLFFVVFLIEMGFPVSLPKKNQGMMESPENEYFLLRLPRVCRFWHPDLVPCTGIVRLWVMLPGGMNFNRRRTNFRGFRPWFGWTTSRGNCVFNRCFLYFWPFQTWDFADFACCSCKICYFSFLCCQAIQSIPAYSDALLNTAAHQKMAISQACWITSTHFDNAILENWKFFLAEATDLRAV